MPCPTCSHAMHKYGESPLGTIFWCPMCGTIRAVPFVPGPPEYAVPALVDRCRLYQEMNWPNGINEKMIWHQLGIAEATHTTNTPKS